MTLVESRILQLLQNGEAVAAIAAQCACTVSQVHVVAGKFGALPRPVPDAPKRQLPRDQKSYHVSLCLTAEQTKRCTAGFPKEFYLNNRDGEPVTLVLGNGPQ